jgi:hypothetical protein
MSLVGINSTVKSSAMADALRRSGYKLRRKPVSWPRLKGPAGIRVDMATGYSVSFVGSMEYNSKKEAV